MLRVQLISSCLTHIIALKGKCLSPLSLFLYVRGSGWLPTMTEGVDVPAGISLPRNLHCLWGGTIWSLPLFAGLPPLLECPVSLKLSPKLHNYRVSLKFCPEAAGMACCPSEGQSPAPSTHVWCLITTCNSISRGSHVLFWSLQASTPQHTEIKIK